MYRAIPCCRVGAGMTLKAFRTTSSQNMDIDVLSKSVRDYTEQLTKNPMLDGILLQNIELSNGKELPHSLGRPWVGMLVTYSTAFAIVRAVKAPQTDISTIYIESDVPTTVDVWVF